LLELLKIMPELHFLGSQRGKVNEGCIMAFPMNSHGVVGQVA
jgi:hypothetical protein